MSGSTELRIGFYSETPNGFKKAGFQEKIMRCLYHRLSAHYKCWMATGNSLGMTKGVFAIPNFGQKELIDISTYITSIFSGLFIAFIDEILFLFATILEPRK